MKVRACDLAGVGSNWTRAPSSQPDPRSVLRVRADCGGRLFSAKFSVVVHNLAHQLFNHLADDPVLLARRFCDRLGDPVNDFIRFIGIDFV